MADQTTVPQLIDHLFRHQAGQIVATLTRIFGPQHLDLAEDVVQETLIKALRQWPYRGVPENPAAWIMRVARNHALDLIRRERSLQDKQAQLLLLAERRPSAPDPADELLDSELHDDMLRMIFICCHGSIRREGRVALTLKTLGGFGVPELARAFLVPDSTIAQRLVRAKRTIRELGLPFAVPEAAELPERLDAVLDVLYLLFNEGYSAHQGEDLVRHDLCAEAIRLASIVARHPAGAAPKVHALLALMLLQAARLPARTDECGDLLLLEQQDRGRWDRRLIALGLGELDRAASGDELSTYHLQAGIAACHALAHSYAATNWPRILWLYDALAELAPSPVVALNRAIALAMVAGPEAGLAELARVEQQPGMPGYHLLHASFGALWQRAGDPARAASAYDRALGLAATEPERRFLRRRIAECR
jgi:RNA polymerase sigma-70 factor (ECF subfamily)